MTRARHPFTPTMHRSAGNGSGIYYAIHFPSACSRTGDGASNGRINGLGHQTDLFFVLLPKPEDFAQGVLGDAEFPAGGVAVAHVAFHGLHGGVIAHLVHGQRAVS